MPAAAITHTERVSAEHGTHDRRDRRARRGRQEHRRAPARRAARLPLPRHGRDVPGADLARAARRSRRSTGARGSAGWPRRIRSTSTRDGACFIAGTDVTAAIRRAEIDRLVPVVARHPEVREVMRARQRELADDGDVVIEGRDIGTVVAPGADVKVYLQADPQVRARPAARGAARDRRRRPRDRPAHARRERRGADAAGRGRRADRHDRAHGRGGRRPRSSSSSRARPRGRRMTRPETSPGRSRSSAFRTSASRRSSTG